MTSNFTNFIKTIKGLGFFHIFCSDILNKIVSFFTVFALVRILSKQDFGEWSYAFNLVNIILLFQGLGSISALLQFCSSSHDEYERDSYFKFGLIFAFASNGLLTGIIVFIALYIRLPLEGSNTILLYLCLLPLLTIFFDFALIYWRSTFQNKIFSFYNFFYTILLGIGTIVGGIFYGVIGVIIGRYFSYIFSIAGAINTLKDDLIRVIHSNELNKEKKFAFIGFAITAMLSNSISSMLYLIDIQLIGIILKSADEVASYQTATIIPFALNFIPLAIMTFSYPYFAQNWDNMKWVKKNYRILLKYLIPLNLSISIVLFIFAPIIVPLLFGDQYSDSVTPFRILALGFFIAGTFRIPAGNILASMRFIKLNLLNAILSGTLNVVINILIIPILGINGAALSTFFTFFVSSCISNFFIIKKIKSY